MNRELFDDINDQLWDEARAERQEWRDAADYGRDEVDRPDQQDLNELTALARAEERHAREAAWGRP